MQRRMSVVVWFVGMAVLTCAGCRQANDAGAPPPGQSQKNKQVVLQLNWYPEAEHGGFYAALVEGLFASEGLGVEIRPGGRATPVASELSLGRAHFAVSNAADVLLFREQGADIVALMAGLQDNPRCLLVREDAGVNSFKELRGQTLQLGTGRPFAEFLRQRGVLEGVRVVPYFGSVTQLVTTPNMAQQGYVFSEPLLAERAGTQVRTLLVSDLGFNPYASVLVTTGDTLRTQRTLVEKMTRACTAGWHRYLEAPAATNAYLVTQNQHGLALDVLDYGAKKMRPLVLPPNGKPQHLGRMTASRWQTLTRQMTDLGLITREKVQATDCYDSTIIP
ncbi:MAG: ABC transporter substrate-binding protein [Pirellulales bacterium]|nr:ABC transporter substrate-binding protein [Pirellulales bacterium]